MAAGMELVCMTLLGRLLAVAPGLRCCYCFSSCHQLIRPGPHEGAIAVGMQRHCTKAGQCVCSGPGLLLLLFAADGRGCVAHLMQGTYITTHTELVSAESCRADLGMALSRQPDGTGRHGGRLAGCCSSCHVVGVVWLE